MTEIVTAVDGSDPVTPCKGCVIIDRLATRRRGRLARSGRHPSRSSASRTRCPARAGDARKTTRYSQLVREGRLLPSQTVARTAEVKLDRVTGEKTVAGRS